MKHLGKYLGAALPLAAFFSPIGATPASAESCPDVQVVFARGTMEPPGVGLAGQAFADALVARAGSRSTNIYPVNYPASLDFATAADGVVDATNMVVSTATTCPATKIVLGGYSQGAAVAAYITEDALPAGITPPPGITGPMPAGVADHVAAVVLFGKPSSGFLQMIYTGAPPVNVGSRYRDKTIDLCIPEDPVCSPTGTDNSSHTTYATNGMASAAADFVTRRLSAGNGDQRQLTYQAGAPG